MTGWWSAAFSGRRRQIGAGRSVARADDHGQAVLGADRGHLADRELEVLGQREGEAGEDERGDRADLELAEAHADARARAPAEGDVGALGQRGARLGREALGAELLGVGEDVGQVVAGPGAVVDERARGDGVAFELERLDRAPRADPGGRVLAEGLIEDQLQLGELAGDQLGGGGRAAWRAERPARRAGARRRRGGGRARRT